MIHRLSEESRRSLIPDASGWITGVTNGLKVTKMYCIVATLSKDGSVKVWPTNTETGDERVDCGKVWFLSDNIEAWELDVCGRCDDRGCDCTYETGIEQKGA